MTAPEEDLVWIYCNWCREPYRQVERAFSEEWHMDGKCKECSEYYRRGEVNPKAWFKDPEFIEMLNRFGEEP